MWGDEGKIEQQNDAEFAGTTRRITLEGDGGTLCRGDKGEPDPGCRKGRHKPVSQEAGIASLSLVFLNGSALWSYFTCLTVQNYYREKFPWARLEFAVTVAVSWPMVISQSVQILWGVQERASITSRVVAGYIIYALCGLFFLLQDIAPSTSLSARARVAIILVLVSVVGLTNTLTESVLYDLAGVFVTNSPQLLQMLQVGNAAAAFLNVLLLTVIRLALSLSSTSGSAGADRDADASARAEHMAYHFFMGILIFVSLLSILVFVFVLCRLPMVKAHLELHRQLRRQASQRHRQALHDPTASPPQNEQGGALDTCRVARVARVAWMPAVSVFLSLGTSLMLFPGAACSAPPSPPFDSPDRYLWYCSPLIVGTYSLGDLISRVTATPAALRRISTRMCLILCMIRAVVMPVLVLLGLQGPLYILPSVWWEAGLMMVLGLSNGFLSTCAVVQGPQLLADEEDKEVASLITVTALYLGIATGASSAFGLQRSVSAGPKTGQ